jgi:hypothetical protein
MARPTKTYRVSFVSLGRPFTLDVQGAENNMQALLHFLQFRSVGFAFNAEYGTLPTTEPEAAVFANKIVTQVYL